MKNVRKLKGLKTGDYILAALFLSCAVIILIWSFSFVGAPAKEGILDVSQKGSVIVSYPLTEDKVFKIKDGEHENTIQIKDGKASVIYANCKNQICVHNKEISREGDRIICLPSRLVLTVRGGEEAQIDAITN